MYLWDTERKYAVIVAVPLNVEWNILDICDLFFWLLKTNGLIYRIVINDKDYFFGEGGEVNDQQDSFGHSCLLQML